MEAPATVWILSASVASGGCWDEESQSKVYGSYTCREVFDSPEAAEEELECWKADDNKSDVVLSEYTLRQ